MLIPQTTHNIVAVEHVATKMEKQLNDEILDSDVRHPTPKSVSLSCPQIRYHVFCNRTKMTTKTLTDVVGITTLVLSGVMDFTKKT